jgi:hypothetical protein
MLKNSQINQDSIRNSNDVETGMCIGPANVNYNYDISCHSPYQIHNSLSPFTSEVCASPNRQTVRQLPEMLVNVGEINDSYEYGVFQTKRPTISMAGLNETSSIENEYITDEMIDITGKILTQIACTNLSYSTYQPIANVKPTSLETHVCPVCQSHTELINLSQYFLKSGMSDLNDITV